MAVSTKHVLVARIYMTEISPIWRNTLYNQQSVLIKEEIP